MAGQGVAYQPPTELLPIFNSNVYGATTSGSYLQYPVAQGAETIGTLTTSNFTLNNSAFALGTGSSATLANQIAIGTSSNTVYMNTPIKSLVSPFSNYLSVRDCGVYLLNGDVVGSQYMYPLYKTTAYSNFYNSTVSAGTVPLADGVGGANGKGNYQIHSMTFIDEGYIVMPRYGLKTYNGASININVSNNTSNPFVVYNTLPNISDNCKIYYDGVEITA